MNRRKGTAGYLVAWACMVLLLATGTAKDLCAAEISSKIGYVDLKVALNESETGKKAKGELESLIKTKQGVIDEKGKTIEKLKGELEKQASVLSPDARKAKEDEIERLLREYQRLVQDSQAELKKKEDKYTESIIKEIRGVIEKVAEEEGYAIILENFEGMILYARKDLDVTDKVVKKFNELKAKQGESKPTQDDSKDEPKSKSKK